MWGEDITEKTLGPRHFKKISYERGKHKKEAAWGHMTLKTASYKKVYSIQ